MTNEDNANEASSGQDGRQKPDVGHIPAQTGSSADPLAAAPQTAPPSLQPHVQPAYASPMQQSGFAPAPAQAQPAAPPSAHVPAPAQQFHPNVSQAVPYTPPVPPYGVHAAVNPHGYQQQVPLVPAGQMPAASVAGAPHGALPPAGLAQPGMGAPQAGPMPTPPPAGGVSPYPGVPAQPGMPVHQGTPYQVQYPPRMPYTTVQAPGTGKAAASLVCGILSIVLSLWVWPAIVLGIIAIILGVQYAKTFGKNGMATGGRVCGIIGLAFSVMFVLAVFLAYVLSPPSYYSGSSSTYRTAMTDYGAAPIERSVDSLGSL